MYKSKIGRYSIESEDGFSSESEAIEYILERYPELEKEDLEGKLDSLLNNGHADKSRNISKQNSESAEVGSEFNSKGSEVSEIRRRK